jgi:Na+/melibiose symporter-like transporter
MEFGESHYMAAAASGVFLVVAFGIPVNIIASGNARAEYFVSISIIFAICVLLSLFIFIPKIKFHSKILKGKKSMRNIVRKFAEQSKFAAQKTKKKEEKKYLTRLDVSENKQHARSIRLADENPQRVKTLNDFDATIPIEGSDA